MLLDRVETLVRSHCAWRHGAVPTASSNGSLQRLSPAQVHANYVWRKEKDARAQVTQQQ